MVRFLFSLILVWCFSANCFAEEWPTLSIVQAVRYSDKTVLAKFLKMENDTFHLIYKDLEDATDEYTDTLVVPDIHRTFYKRIPQYSRSKFSFLSVENAEEYLIFLKKSSKNKWQPISWRFLANDTIYQPYQLENPGNFHLLKIGEEINWQTLQRRIKQARKRIDSIWTMKAIANDTLRNQVLLQWLNDNFDTFEDYYDSRCTLNEDCGWAYLNTDMLKWILEAGIAKDTWTIGLFSLKINQKNLYDTGKQSFAFPAERLFLVEKAMTDTLPLEVRKLALRFLGSNLWLRSSWDKDKRNGIELTTKEQLNLMQTIKPLLDHEELAKPAFQVLSRLSNPRDGNLKEHIYLQLLPDFIEKYQSLPPVQYNNDLRIKLGEFISYNADEATWKLVSGSDANQYFKVYHFHIDSTKNEFRFNFYNQRNKSLRKNINSKPIIQLKRIENNKTVETMTCSINDDLNVFNRLSGGAITLSFDISNLKKGTYYFQVIGTVGEQNEFNFISEIGQFTL